MKLRLLIGILTLCIAFTINAQQEIMYRIELKDKGESGFSVDKPEEFLSSKSIERRKKQGFPVDETDLPIAREYFDRLVALGADIKASSKWAKTIAFKIKAEDERIEKIEQLPFVEKMYPVWRSKGSEESPNIIRKAFYLEDKTPEEIYGTGFTQIEILNGTALHEAGFRGEDITIAVLDAGFTNVDVLEHFDKNRIIEAKEFSHEGANLYRVSQDHGTMALSCMLAEREEYFVGTAPKASYCLFKTEVNNEEFPIEEDYWVQAVEYADSIGCDIVSSSLGYYDFDDKNMNHSRDMLDGKTVPISKVASMAGNKGMIICISAGNEGNKTWEKIVFPADAENVLTVGGITKEGKLSYFSSRGNTEDGRIKPDVVAIATNTYLINKKGESRASGTSFSCPTISGMVACLWQALPSKTSMEIMSIIRESSDKYQAPDSCFGYGIPDFYQAYLDNRDKTNLELIPKDDLLIVDYTTKCIRIDLNNTNGSEVNLRIYSSTGQQVGSSSHSFDMTSLRPGIYIAILSHNGFQYSRKILIK
ncbi:S8 family peptidase [Bacteroidales bacterium OttesenSCG-928-M11]|nr:S8 family peptidase [Bacteroidales bacterium OttesenSCG-928-M11]